MIIGQSPYCRTDLSSVSRGVSESRTRDQSVFRAKLNKLFIVGRHDACFTPFRFRSEVG